MDIIALIKAVIELLFQIFTKEEWIALLAAWWLGVVITETFKRTIRAFILKSSINNNYAFEKVQVGFMTLGVIVTSTTTYLLWPNPKEAVFDSALTAALLNGFSAPIFYRMFMAFLRRRGCDWLVSALTGDRRKENKGPIEGIGERRKNGGSNGAIF